MGSTKNSKTVSGDASIITSRVTGSPCVSLMPFLPLRQALELIQAARPERLEVSDHFVDSFRVGLVDAGPTHAPLDHEVCVPENGQMLGYRRSGRMEVSGDVTGAHPLDSDELDDSTAGWICQGSEGGVDIGHRNRDSVGLRKQ
jgi:hypothetical protein